MSAASESQVSDSDTLRVKNGWALDKATLKKFVLNNVNNRLGHDVKEKVMPQVQEFGGCEGITSKLGASLVSGISKETVEDRKEVYGINYVAPPPPTPFWRFCMEAMEDFTLQMLLFFAALQMAIGFGIDHARECLEFIDGIAIFCTVALVVFVGAFQEKQKEAKFRALSENSSEEFVNVIRDGLQQKINTKEVVVGDTVLLTTGDVLCVDGIVYERNTLSIFEGPLTGESTPMSKGQYEFREHGTWEMPKDEDLKQYFNFPPEMPLDEIKAKYLPTPKKTPIVFAGTSVQDGEGKMIVTAVGLNTYQESLLAEKPKDKDPENTEAEDAPAEDNEKGGRSIMQKKLDDMTYQITNAGLIFGVGTVVALLIRLAVLFGEKACCYEVWQSDVHVMQIVQFIILGIVIFVVAVPEGLPLAVTIALAFSVGKMYDDMCQVKTSSACETMGSATTICSDKTGTLTTSMMTVMKTFVAGEQMTPDKVAKAVDPGMKELMQLGMTINTSEKTDLIAKVKETKAMKQVPSCFGLSSKSVVDQDAPPKKEHVKMPDGKLTMAYSGNATECAMLKMVNQLGQPDDASGEPFLGDPGDPGMPYKKIRARFPESLEGRAGISFSSKRKRMSTLVPLPPPCSGGEAPFRLYCKGASEMVLELCTKVASRSGEDEPMTPEEKAKINLAIDDFANEGLRTIGVAYKNMSSSPVNSEGGLPEEVEQGLTLICIVGIEDPLRDEVPGAIATCRGAGITVRMVTGDNLSTAKAISKKANILSEEGMASGDEIAMTGEQFRQKVLTQQNKEDPENYINQAAFDEVWPKLRCLARSTPTDKLVLVTGIQNSRIWVEVKEEKTGKIYKYNRQVVAVTGDGTNDAPALKQADVGFAMFINGTQVAQKASDIVILDDNFISIVQAVKWGRVVYDNICKFLQFQLTVNIVSCWLAMVGSAVLTVPPIGVLQLLWVNLIMDSFASLALATEDPNQPNGLKEQVLGRFPYKRTDPLLSKMMVRNMLGHSVLQLGIMCYIVFGMGDVCEMGSSHNICAGSPEWNDGEWRIRSGRPIEFDKILIKDYDLWNCVPRYDKNNTLTYFEVHGLPLDGSGMIVSGVMPYRSSLYDGCNAGHSCGKPSQHFTMVFHSFVFMQIFNEINARKLFNEANVFRGLQYHMMFIYVFIGTLIMQFVLVELPGVNTTFGCEHLEWWQHIFCFITGIFSLPWQFCVVRFFPAEWIPLGSWAGSIDESDLDELTKKEPERGKKEIKIPSIPRSK